MSANDFWTTEKFEREVTAATVALYETEIDPRREQNTIHRFNRDELEAVRRHGVFIPAPDRVVIVGGTMSVLKWPASGCVSFGGCYKWNATDPAEDMIESYCRLIYFRRLNRLPSHSQPVANAQFSTSSPHITAESKPARILTCANSCAEPAKS